MTLIYLALTVLLSQTQPIRPMVHYFYSPSCGHCMDILLDDIPKLKVKYQFILKKYDIDVLESYKLLEKMEEKVANKTDDLPVVFVADSVFYGPETVRKKLGLTLKALANYHIDTLPQDTLKPYVDTSCKRSTDTLNLYYFYQLECPECSRLEVLLNTMKKIYPLLIIYRYDIFYDSSKIFYETLARLRRIPEEKRLVVPAVFIGEDCRIKDISSKDIEGLLIKYSNAGAGTPRLDTLIVHKENGASGIIERFARFSIIGIMLAGLLDGINPCAFATIVFFISYLLFIGRRQRDVIIMSVSFIIAVFICYLAIGTGAYGLLRYLSKFAIIIKALFLCFGVAAVIFGVISIYDFILAKKGNYSRMVLQLPLSVKQRIHSRIKEKTRSASIVLGSIIAGFLISFLEFGCTGQVYLPTIFFMISKAGKSLKPISALILYNLAFIVPLTIIALFAILFSTQRVARHLEKHVPTIKLLTALLFFGL